MATHFKSNLSQARVKSVMFTLNRIAAHFRKNHTGEATIMFNKNSVHILFDGKLQYSVSLRHLHTVLK